MNKLPLAKRAHILTLLCEGMSMRSIERTAGCSINTVDKLLRDAGEAALWYHDRHVRDVKARRVQCDEIWSFVHAKAKNAQRSSRASDPTIGDCWTWTAIDADSKLLISYLVGGRDAEYTPTRPAHGTRCTPGTSCTASTIKKPIASGTKRRRTPTTPRAFSAVCAAGKLGIIIMWPART